MKSVRSNDKDKVMAFIRAVKTRAINIMIAKAIISSVLGPSVLMYHITGQQYRLKVLIGFGRKSVIRLHIHYMNIAKKNI